MSIKLVSTNPDYLERTASVPSVSYPFAMSLWFNPTALNLDMVLASLADNTVEDNFHALLFKGTLGTNYVHALSYDAAAISVAGITATNQWWHVLGVWESASSRKIYLNGTNEGTDATAKTIAGLNTLTVGRLGKATPSNPTAGRVAHLAIWDLSTLFSAEERSQLGIVGASPLLIRADELVSYAPMPGIDADPVVDVVGGFHLTQNGSPTTGENNPPVLDPLPGQVEPPPISSINASVGNTLAFGQIADNNIKVGTPTSSLAFGQSATHNIKLGTPSSSIAFGQTADTNIKQGAGVNTIAFDSAEIGTNVVLLSASNSILFNSLDPETNIKYIQVANAIAFGAFAGRHIELSVGNELLFLGDVISNIKVLFVQNSVTFAPDPQSEGSEYSRSIVSQFLFEQAVRRTIEGSASNSIAFGEEAARRLDGVNQLLFDGVVTYDKGKALINEILFGQSVSVNYDLNKALGNSILFGQLVVGVVSDKCKLYKYAPNGALPAITLGVRAGIRLESGAFNIELRNPSFGNGDTVEPLRILRRSRGGTINLVRDDIWPNKVTLSMNFVGLTRVKAQEFITFLENTLGQAVTLTDQENQTWLGVILNPDAGIADLQGHSDCNYSTDLQFIGERT